MKIFPRATDTFSKKRSTGAHVVAGLLFFAVIIAFGLFWTQNQLSKAKKAAICLEINDAVHKETLAKMATITSGKTNGGGLAGDVTDILFGTPAPSDKTDMTEFASIFTDTIATITAATAKKYRLAKEQIDKICE